MAKDVGVFMCGASAILVNQVRSSRGFQYQVCP